MKIALLLKIGLVAAAISACDDGQIVRPQQYATVRVINAAVPPVDTLAIFRSGVEGVPVVFARARMASDCIVVPAGTTTLRFRQIRGATDLATIQYDFTAGERYTIVFSGNAQARQATVLTDVFTPPDTAVSNQVRFINATSTAGNVHATVPNATPGTPVATNLAVIGTSNADPSWLTIPRASTQIRLFNVGTTTGTPRATFNLTVPATTRTTSVVFMDAGTPAGVTALRVDPCT